jgi:hypothetical protein
LAVGDAGLDNGLAGFDAVSGAGLAAGLDAARFFDAVVRFAIRVVCRRS